MHSLYIFLPLQFITMHHNPVIKSVAEYSKSVTILAIKSMASSTDTYAFSST